jgi:hypothetical protein
MGIIHHQTARFYRRQQALLKLALQRCRFGIQRAKRRFLLPSSVAPARVKRCQVTSSRRLAVKGERLSLLPHALHPLKKRIVKPDIIRQFRQLRGKLLIKRLNGRVGLRARHREKDVGYPRQQLAALFQGLQRVGKISRLRVINDGVNLCALAANALVEGRTVMTHVNQIETRRLIRQQADAKKGLFSDIFISWIRLFCKIRQLID